MQWKSSLRYDAQTNVVTLDPNWQGPWAPLDVNALAPGAWDTTTVTLKGSHWNWDEFHLIDDGTLGDPTANDGRLTFQLSQYIGPEGYLPHVGLARSGDHIEIMPVFHGKEYRDSDGHGMRTGVSAFKKAPGDAAFVPLVVSTGAGNAFVVVP